MSVPLSSNPFDLSSHELESMEQLLDSANGSKDISHKGKLVEGAFLTASERDLYFDIGEKQDGQCPRGEFEQLPAPGERVQLMVVQGGEDGLLRLSFREAKNWLAWQAICDAQSVESALTGKISKIFEHGYLVDYESLQLYMPFSQSSIRPNFQQRLALQSEVSFHVLELKRKYRSAIISHRRVAELSSQALWDSFLANHREGDLVEGKVLKKVSFGLFVVVDGIEGLLHQSDLSWRRNASFKKRFHINEKLQLKILKIDGENRHLNLGLKQLSEDPWIMAKREFSKGQVLEGRVTAIRDYGAFVELPGYLEGLLHISKITWSRHPGHPKKYVSLGDKVTVQLLDIDTEKKRLALGMKGLQGDPWDKVGKEINEGDIIEGEVLVVNRFGAFVEICPGLEGLIRFNDYGWKEPVDKEMLSARQKIRFTIVEISYTEKRIRCGIKQLDENPYQKLWRELSKGSVIEGEVVRIMSFGVFVRINEALDGLIPKSEAVFKPDGELKDSYKVGEKIKVVLREINVAKQKVLLSSKALKLGEEQEVAGQYIKKEHSPSTSSPFAALLKDQLPSK